jgi:hypothetical protein
MVKFRLPQQFIMRTYARRSPCGNHADLRVGAARQDAYKILIEFDFLEFDKNSHRIRGDFAQNCRFIANDSFKPVC